MPVRNRQNNNSLKDAEIKIPALQNAPKMAQAKNTFTGENLSGIERSAKKKVPRINPN